MPTTLACRPPFELRYSLAFLQGFSPMRGDQLVARGTLTKAILHRARPVAFRVRQAGPAASPLLGCELFAKGTVDRALAQDILARIAFFLSADDDLCPFYAMAEADRAFAPLAQRLRGFHHPKFPSPFEAACWAALYQRVQLPAARKMKESLMRRAGASVRVDGVEHWAFPDPEALAQIGEPELAALLGHTRKARTIAAIATAFAGVDEDFLREAPLADVQKWLARIHGVGPFTTAFVLYRGLGRFAGLPMAPGLVRAAERVYGRSLRVGDVKKLSETYGPWAGQWALYLWASTFFPDGSAPHAPTAKYMTSFARPSNG